MWIGESHDRVPHTFCIRLSWSDLSVMNPCGWEEGGGGGAGGRGAGQPWRATVAGEGKKWGVVSSTVSLIMG